MKPYYERNGITLYVADCREVLPLLGRGRADGFHLLLTDPPYGVEATASRMRVKQLALDTITNDAPADASVVREGLSLAWQNLRVSRHAYVFGPFDMTTLPHACGTCELIWDKIIVGMGDLESPVGQSHEPIQFAMRADGPAQTKRGEGGVAARVRRGSVFRYQRHSGSGAKHHIADKPVALLRELIEMSTRHGETVLDPFCGSGPTLVAALLEGRSAVGIEIEEEWAEVAAARLESLTQQGSLFAGVA